MQANSAFYITHVLSQLQVLLFLKCGYADNARVAQSFKLM